MEDETEFYVNPQLLPAKNIRKASPRACSFCRFFLEDEGLGWCIRPTARGMMHKTDIIFDLSEMEQYYTVCDRWKEKQ